MKRVTAGFCYHVDHGSGITTELRVVIVRNNTKLGDGVWRGLDGRRVNELIAGMAAVDHIIVRACSPAIDGNDPRLSPTKEQVGSQRTLHARLQLKQLKSVT